MLALILAVGSSLAVQAMYNPDKDMVVQFYKAYERGNLTRFVQTFSAPALRRAVEGIARTILGRAEILLSFENAAQAQIDEAIAMLTLMIDVTGNAEAIDFRNKVLTMQQKKGEREAAALNNIARRYNLLPIHTVKHNHAKKCKSKL